MGEWKEYSLGDLGTIITGKTPSSNYPDEFGSDIPFVTPSDYGNYRKWATSAERGLSKKGIEKLEEKVIPKSSLLVTCIGSDMGKVVMNKIPVITNQQINSIIPNKQVDANYFYYKLLDIYGILRMYGLSGTAVPILNKGDFEKIEIEIPIDISEQTAIASVLVSLDDKIDLLQRQNKTLEQLAETLFRQWFVEEANQKEKIEIGEIAKVGTGEGLKREEFKEDGKYPILGANGEIGRTDNYLTEGHLILTGRVGTLGKVYINENKAWISDNVLIVKPFNELLFYPIYFTLKNYDFENLNAGSTQPLVTQTGLKTIILTLPNEELRSEFARQCRVYFEKRSKNKQQINTLTRLRDTLLPKLMSGEVKVA